MNVVMSRWVPCGGTSLRSFSLFVLGMSLLAFALPAFGQVGGLDNISSLLEQIVAFMNTISLPVATIAVAAFAIQMLVMGKSFGESWPVLAGGAILGGAGPIAQLILG